jgi:hypothetical protein
MDVSFLAKSRKAVQYLPKQARRKDCPDAKAFSRFCYFLALRCGCGLPLEVR